MSKRYRPRHILQLGPQPADPREIRFSIAILLGVGGVILAALSYAAAGYGGLAVLTILGIGFFALLGIGGAGWWEYIKAKGGRV